MKINESESVINCIDGIKALSGFFLSFVRNHEIKYIFFLAIMIIIGHRQNYLNPSFSSWSTSQQVVMTFLSSYAYCVVSFFACSGVLIAQSMLKALNQ